MLPGLNLPSSSTAVVLAVRCKHVLSVFFLVLLVATRIGTSAQNQNPESSESSVSMSLLILAFKANYRSIDVTLLDCSLTCSCL
jgi:hypothetical protein